ncbi:MAG: hypothetical protein JW834_01815 [Candidatus Diapherotrites archaeon]|nr:hypothetical protein [Candidatus Diapherotrites archaeon]
MEPSLTIGIPALESVPIAFFNAYNALLKPARTVTVTTTYKPLDVARQRIAENMSTDYLLFMDTDTLPPANAFQKLVAHDVPIVGGLYFQKTPPFKPLLWKRREGDPPFWPITKWASGEVVEVDGTGCGFLLVKKEVFDALEKPFFKWTEVGEDFYFCDKAREAGFKVFVDTSVECKHLTSLGVGYDFYKANSPLYEGV